MAGIFRGQSSGVARALLFALLFVVVASPAALAQLYKQPVLIVDPGMHTAPIKDVGVDAAGQIAVTGGFDKALRVWSLPDGELLRSIRVPAGPGDIGEIYAVAVQPDGALVAAGGWTNSAPEESVYLFETRTGKMAARIAGLPGGNTNKLAFSPDGHYLAAGFDDGGLRIYDRDQQWREVFRDTDYAGSIYGITFSADGRLATTSLDGNVRLYDSDFRLVVPAKKVIGRPIGIAFSPNGALLAVGHLDEPTVDLFDGHSLSLLPGPNVDGLTEGALAYVAWSKDGATLYAGGKEAGANHVLVWAGAGSGGRSSFPASRDTVVGLIVLSDSQLLVAAQDPLLELLGPDGGRRWAHASPTADFRGQYNRLAVSADGTIVDFGVEFLGQPSLRFDLRALKLSANPSADQQTNVAKQAGLAVDGWVNNMSPTLDGKPIEIMRDEKSRSLAIRPDNTRFVLGADWYVRAFDAKGTLIWRRDEPSATWAVNISADGRLVILAHGDGTIRWHRLDDGRELLALYVLANKQDWVAWTPEGFYGATPGAFGILRWQVNRGFDAAADTVPVNAIPSLRQPDALPFVLQELETARALGIAALKAARRDVQVVTGAPVAPGARLFILTIGVKNYGDKAKDLKLEFADKDARDVANALVNTQEGGLYARVIPQFLSDEATKPGIFDALTAMERGMERGSGQDLALVMFSGHGTMIDDQLYLVPNGADDSTPGRLRASAIPATEFQDEIAKLARGGRVLVLLDTCHSAGLIGALPASNALKSALASGNVTVLTSTKTADKLSKEYEKWGHGAFTKALLDALSASNEVDTNHDGVISISEFSTYIGKHLTELTGGDQQLGIEQRFLGDIFVAGL
jgi:hypothetical protein